MNTLQAKIHTLSQRYGANPDAWPIAKSIQPVYPVDPLPTPPPLPPPSPAVQVSWTIEATGRRGSHDQPSLTSSRSSSVSQTPLDLDHPLFANVTLPAPSPKVSTFDDSQILSGSREEPDGRSDASNHSTDPNNVLTASPPSLTPPSSPHPLSFGDQRAQVTPGMISSALGAVTHAASQASSLSHTPQDEPHLPELISQALSSWISENASVCSTPPSTPLDVDDGGGCVQQAVSASDLISALTSALSQHRAEEGVGGGSGRESIVPSVPACTPQEELLELAKLGIQPDDILEALQALSSVRKDEGDEEAEKEVEEEKDSIVSSESDVSLQEESKMEETGKLQVETETDKEVTENSPKESEVKENETINEEVTDEESGDKENEKEEKLPIVKEEVREEVVVTEMVGQVLDYSIEVEATPLPKDNTDLLEESDKLSNQVGDNYVKSGCSEVQSDKSQDNS